MIEACLWALIFLPPRARTLTAVLYDDGCNLCRRAVAILRVLNAPRQTYELLALSRHEDLLQEHGLTPEAVQESIHGIHDGRVLVGYALYELISRRNPLLWPVWPLMVLGRLLGVGPRIYTWVASNRRHLFGTCELAGDTA